MLLLAACSMYVNRNRAAYVCHVGSEKAAGASKHQGITVLLVAKASSSTVGANDLGREHHEFRESIFDILVDSRGLRHLFDRHRGT